MVTKIQAYNIDACGQSYKQFTTSNLQLQQDKVTQHGVAAVAYKATAVNNECKMFAKLTPDYYTLSQLMDKKLETIRKPSHCGNVHHGEVSQCVFQCEPLLSKPKILREAVAYTNCALFLWQTLKKAWKYQTSLKMAESDKTHQLTIPCFKISPLKFCSTASTYLGELFCQKNIPKT